ncbi:Rhoptry kinase family protein [Toxoplasma gondii MAS]|uniref:Rhoptry kinase family protein n=2 Tax=Toxoplasma gondii TaxID=5811 RepID=A0A086QDT1_TOXGO|nr:Rhoptry kinase family protein [Toxoplasma gondii MAS]PUA90809.1 rhoptry kinase family protein [Toxoplasma gondii TgCATBr9]
MRFSAVLYMLSTCAVCGASLGLTSDEVDTVANTDAAGPAEQNDRFRKLGEKLRSSSDKNETDRATSESEDAHLWSSGSEGASGAPDELTSVTSMPFEEDIGYSQADLTGYSASTSQQSESWAKRAVRKGAAPFLEASESSSASPGVLGLGWSFVRSVWDDLKDLQSSNSSRDKQKEGDEAVNETGQNESFSWTSLWKWWSFYANLPELVETDYEEMKDVVRSMESSKEPVTRQVYMGSAKLAEDLRVPHALLTGGFTVKMCPGSRSKPWKALTEIFLRKKLLPPNSPFFVPLVATAKGKEAATLQFFPPTRGSLRAIATQAPEKLNVVLVMAEMVAAVEALHGLGILHGALSLDAFYVSREGHVQLSDFDSAIVDNVFRPISEMAEPVRDGYRALSRKLNISLLHTKAADVFSLGKAFEALADLTDLENGDRLMLEVLVERMTQADSEKRPSLNDIARDKFFDRVDFDSVRARTNPCVYSCRWRREKMSANDAATTASDADEDSDDDDLP